MRAADSFDSAVDFLDDRLRTALLGVDSRVKESAYEIRLRAARPVVIVTRVGSLFVYKSGRTGSVYSPGALAVTPAELQASFSRMCGYSVHSNSAAAASGFISLAHGHRAGVCGTAVMAESGTVKSFRDISSVNLRIAHEVPGSSDEIYPSLFSQGIVSAIIAGPPLSGKTTLLRDLARAPSWNHLAGDGKRASFQSFPERVAHKQAPSPQETSFASILIVLLRPVQRDIG